MTGFGKPRVSFQEAWTAQGAVNEPLEGPEEGSDTVKLGFWRGEKAHCPQLLGVVLKQDSRVRKLSCLDWNLRYDASWLGGLRQDLHSPIWALVFTSAS